MALGMVVLVMSWRMDRLEDQDINPVTIPGLVPGLLGVAMIALSGLMVVRGVRRGGWYVRVAAPGLDWRRFVLVLLLCLGFALGLVGRVPFWLAAWLFVSGSILALRWREMAGRRPRLGVTSGLIGLGVGLAVTLVFERVFLVRLP
jgi:putative tricarboxylic transport membrane protein